MTVQLISPPPVLPPNRQRLAALVSLLRGSEVVGYYQLAIVAYEPNDNPAASVVSQELTALAAARAGGAFIPGAFYHRVVPWNGDFTSGCPHPGEGDRPICPAVAREVFLEMGVTLTLDGRVDMGRHCIGILDLLSRARAAGVLSTDEVVQRLYWLAEHPAYLENTPARDMEERSE